MDDLTPEERKAIAALKRLAKRWPYTLWVFSASGRLCVMRHGEEGHQHMPDGGIDPTYCVDEIDIENDGGDW